MSAQQPSFSQVDTVGCADEGLWIFSLEDSMKRQHTVNWEDQSWNKTEEHELMIDSGCFGHVCPPSNVTEDGEKHSVIWGMFMSSTVEASVFMGKKYSDNLHSIKNT